MKLSYLITCKNEDISLEKLFEKIIQYKSDNHEIIVIDDYSDNEKTLEILNKYSDKITLHKRKLENDYGAQKNFGIESCNGEWIFQIDADECPTDMLLANIDNILDSNSETEVIWLPRMNIFHGVTDNDIKQWGWRYEDGLINWPDVQSRLFRNMDHIRYERRLHEKVEGYKTYTFVPPQKDIALVHEKSIEKQRNTNIRYNENFSETENRGYVVK